MAKSKVAQILEVVRGSMIFGDGLAEYNVAREIRDANRCGTTPARFNAARRAAQRTRLVISRDEGMGIIRIRNNETRLEYTMHP